MNKSHAQNFLDLHNEDVALTLSVLEAGRDYLMSHDRIRYEYSDGNYQDDPNVCALGAVRVQIAQQEQRSVWMQRGIPSCDLWDLADARLTLEIPEGTLCAGSEEGGHSSCVLTEASVPCYNDRLDTTDADIFALYDRAILKAKQEVADKS